jgi:hypothetical protein
MGSFAVFAAQDDRWKETIVYVLALVFALTLPQLAQRVDAVPGR